ncbi:uncharacterized protein LOC131916443 isoform X4 [Peromyscus eremicus]|uniref:uncharacterized protein LOC131916443 isoform X4 n=1 Tax=Peromyscus eremicus TaxID=42410 RepID=UPI0027DE786E|nr:uncharacterized protein LOC131916443 isoform X4 [Peromyscus eremicus]
MLQDVEGVRSAGSKTKEAGEDGAAEEGPLLSKVEPRKDVKDWRLPTALGAVNPPLISSGLSDSKAAGRSCELSPPITKSFRIYDVSPLSSPNLLQTEKMCSYRRARMARLPQQGPFRHLMDMKAEKRLAGWKERRSRFGDISTHKCYQFGQIFSPFQALATTEKIFSFHVCSLPAHRTGGCKELRIILPSATIHSLLGCMGQRPLREVQGKIIRQ